ncbi:hypothetical protein KIPE111705_06610 [Kibdelosporangium persicum]|uniref:Uncharacterized protein n=1 Tax=Kibdelosporangium persicum TaxID=2698649 RepID=A0ABX2F316_9PSEU|nr:hypothetical protein [Kibdelosporangium persicum]NRN65697.1 hypothetical protein [Kibdelosporangium persicum]
MLLYLRCRSVPAALTTMVAATAGVWALDVPDVRILLLALGLGVAVAALGLGGADVHLDRTGALPWPLWRSAHLVLVALAVFGLTAAVNLWDIEVVLRNTAGLTGLAGLGAVTLGSQLAWSPPALWAAVGAVWPPDNEILLWLTQGPDSGPALATAVVLGVAGLVAYAAFGPKRTS